MPCRAPELYIWPVAARKVLDKMPALSPTPAQHKMTPKKAAAWGTEWQLPSGHRAFLTVCYGGGSHCDPTLRPPLHEVAHGDRKSRCSKTGGRDEEGEVKMPRPIRHGPARTLQGAGQALRYGAASASCTDEESPKLLRVHIEEMVRERQRFLTDPKTAIRLPDSRDTLATVHMHLKPLYRNFALGAQTL